MAGVILEEDRQCLLCNDWPADEPVLLENGRWACQCLGCRRWFPPHGCESKQGAVTAWHRLMHPQYAEKAMRFGDAYGFPLGFE